MGDPRSYQFDLDSAKRPAGSVLAERWYPGIKDPALAASSSRIYDPIKGIRAVVIHATAGGSSAGAASVIFAADASFHWLVPDEDEPQHGHFVWATCHEARAAWHVRNSASHPDVWQGHNKINHFSIGIELVNRQAASDGYSEWQIDATAAIARYCWAKYPNLRHVVSHAKLDPARRADPGSQFPWAEFKKKVLTAPAAAPPALAMESALGETVMPTGSCCMAA